MRTCKLCGYEVNELDDVCFGCFTWDGPNGPVNELCAVCGSPTGKPYTVRKPWKAPLCSQHKPQQQSTWVPLKMLCGHCAMWAVRQSPYPVPDNLENALTLLHAKARTLFDENGMGCFNRRELAEFIDKHFISLLHVQAWNNRKNGNNAAIKVVSRYDGKSDPDDDLIDLDALRQNISATIWRESQDLI